MEERSGQEFLDFVGYGNFFVVRPRSVLVLVRDVASPAGFSWMTSPHFSFAGGGYRQYLAPAHQPFGEFLAPARQRSSLGAVVHWWTSLAGGHRSAVDVAQRCNSAVDVARPCCSAVDVVRLCCSTVDVARRLHSVVDVAWGPLALPLGPVLPPPVSLLLLAPPTCLALILAPPTCFAFDRLLREQGGKDVSVQLLELHQGSDTAADYAIKFRTLAAQSGWNDAALLAVFREGLNPADTDTTLFLFIGTAIRLDNLRLQHLMSTFPRHQPQRHTGFQAPKEEVPEPMQLGRSQVSKQERQRQRHTDMRLCYYCGQPGHQVYRCPEKPSTSQVGEAMLSSKVSLPTLLHHSLQIPSFSALIDSGSAVNIIDRGLIGLFHQEKLFFYIITSPTNPIILGLPWLQQHEPLISWREGELVRWSQHCLHTCFPFATPVACLTTSVQRPTSNELIMLPKEYEDLREVGSKEKASRLPPHRPWVCAIDFLPNTMPPKSRVYPLSLPENQAMEEYVEEALALGFIRPSTSPATAGFFFVEKKDGGLRPCIDYRGLNAFTVRYAYPLPLVPAALEQLRGARIFSKLDLRSA
ncbi:hypothetical protein QTP70_014728 [Hemibagrus guttatus]|uniref:CCHC-type domain-containing protein n=1 Tax=Hemibagrus guttatus TaxID=175788 RepID=A0AAE0QIN4_9TELE|nr:hypothetical protein QTP70_014728 [Hemibagrus guttatus]